MQCHCLDVSFSSTTHNCLMNHTQVLCSATLHSKSHYAYSTITDLDFDFWQTVCNASFGTDACSGKLHASNTPLSPHLASQACYLESVAKKAPMIAVLPTTHHHRNHMKNVKPASNPLPRDQHDVQCKPGEPADKQSAALMTIADIVEAARAANKPLPARAVIVTKKSAFLKEDYKKGAVLPQEVEFEASRALTVNDTQSS